MNWRWDDGWERDDSEYMLRHEEEDCMRLRAKANESPEICLDAEERRVLRKASTVVGMLAKYHGGEQEKECAAVMAMIAERWGKEPPYGKK